MLTQIRGKPRFYKTKKT